MKKKRKILEFLFLKKRKKERKMEQIEVQIEIEPENIDGIIEHTAEAHAWISGNLDGYVHIWKVDLSFTNLKEKIYFSIPSTQMQHDKALEIELYTHSQNTQEDDSNSVMKRSAGVACFALFHLLSHKNKELRHELITFFLFSFFFLLRKKEKI
jgi:hypothetical protein